MASGSSGDAARSLKVVGVLDLNLPVNKYMTIRCDNGTSMLLDRDTYLVLQQVASVVVPSEGLTLRPGSTDQPRLAPNDDQIMTSFYPAYELTYQIRGIDDAGQSIGVLQDWLR